MQQFDYIETNGITLRVAIAGDGPLVILVHGFPESWYSWRHQIEALSSAGFRVAAPDVRGYGGSDKPNPVDAYSIEALTGDIAGLSEALSPGAPVVVVGHDWGAPIAWNSALLHPDRFSAVAGLSVPYAPPGEKTTLELTNEAFVDKGRFFYLHYFQAEGVAEAEFEADIPAAIRGMYYAWSGDAPRNFWHNRRPPTATMFEGIDPIPEQMPDWFSHDDVAHYVSEFERSGFRGPLNRYRNFERDHHFLKRQTNHVIRQPALFIGGTKDPALVMYPPDPAETMRPHFEDLRAVHMLDGIGHWTQQEAPDAVNRHLIEWLRSL